MIVFHTSFQLLLLLLLLSSLVGCVMTQGNPFQHLFGINCHFLRKLYKDIVVNKIDALQTECQQQNAIQRGEKGTRGFVLKTQTP